MELVYCAGGNPAFARIAIAAGFRYGARLPCATYGPVWFADQEWRRPDRGAYMRALAAHRPELATVLDWEREDQLPAVLSWAEEAAQHAAWVVVIPKVQGGVGRLPRRVGGAGVVLGYSEPTHYGGTSLPLWEFAGWPVHLLGGSPQKQYRVWRHLSALADVVSADGNQSNQQAHHCRFWSPTKGRKGHWHQLRDAGLGAVRRDANALAFERSCRNIMAAWQEWTGGTAA